MIPWLAQREECKAEMMNGTGVKLELESNGGGVKLGMMCQMGFHELEWRSYIILKRPAMQW